MRVYFVLALLLVSCSLLVHFTEANPLEKFGDLVKKLKSKVDGIFKKKQGSRSGVPEPGVVTATALSGGSVVVPVIDVGRLFSGTVDDRMAISAQIARACEDIGFFVIVNHGISDEVIANAWRTTRDFFDLPEEEKLKLVKPQAEYPFGYSKFGGEVLSAGKAAEVKGGDETKSSAPPDLKELFSLGPDHPQSGFPGRLFPESPVDFSDAWTSYYSEMNKLASRILGCFALALNLDENFFEQFVDHHASALRALNYPHIEGYVPSPGQLRASAHTDYGTITILRSDAPGLQVSKDKDPPNWIDVPFVKDGLIVNLGDLMKRWTNDRWLSTLHRVVNPVASDTCWAENGSTRRQSMAFFHNPNRDALITVLNAESPKYEPIFAGEFLMQKHLAAVGGKE